MARRLAQTALTMRIGEGQERNARLINARFSSGRGGGASRNGAGHLMEVDLSDHADDSKENNDIEVFGINRLEDAIHRIIVRRAAPDWLPFLPGASYWVPPRNDNRHTNSSDLVAKLRGNKPLTDEEIMSVLTARGWPSSTYYIHGASPHPVEEVSVVKIVSLADEEEGG